MKRNFKVSIFMTATVSLLVFQNCGQAFRPNASLASSDSQSSTTVQSVFKCDPSQEPTPTSARRLTKLELKQSFDLLLRESLSPADQANVAGVLAPLVSAVPDDSGAKFDSDDTFLSSTHTSAYLSLARTFAAEIFKSDARLKAFWGACASVTSLSDTCIDSFLTQGAAQILRRPLTAAEILTFKTQMKTFASKQGEFLLSRLLLHPNFIFQVEVEGLEVKPGLVKISAYELASRLSFHLLKQAPDKALMAKAKDGSLLSVDTIRAEITRLSATYPAQVSTGIEQFFAGWLNYKNVANPVAGTTPEETAFAEGKVLSRQSLLNELKNMTQYYVNEGQGSFDDLFLSPYSFASDSDLASIYQVGTWDPQTKPLIPFPNQERFGLLFRGAFLVSGSVRTSPITRGLKLRREVLCDTLTPPPAAIADMVRDPVEDPALSTRQRFHNKTSSTACMGCHAQINPLGFALENFDAFGRFRTMEKVYDSTGLLLNQILIDPVVQPLISMADTRTSKNPAEFSHMITDSGKARACMVESYFRYTFKTSADRNKDGCSLAALDQMARSPAGLKKIFYDTPTMDLFQIRKVD